MKRFRLSTLFLHFLEYFSIYYKLTYHLYIILNILLRSLFKRFEVLVLIGFLVCITIGVERFLYDLQMHLSRAICFVGRSSI